MENRAVRPRGFSIILLAAFLTIAAGWLKAVYAADIEAVLDDAAGASVFSVKDSSSVEGAHIDSDGNMVIKGGLRLDASGAEHTTAENLIVDGSVGIGDTSPASALTVGLGDLFQVDTSGDIIKLKNITYAWPSSQAAGSSYVLTNNGAGTLSWTAPGGISASSALSAITAAIAANTIANANFAQAWNWDTLTTETAMALGSTSITSGKLLSLSSSATGFTGTMQDITLSGNNAANTGTLFKSTVSGVASAAVPLMITNAGTGLSLRVNDDGTDTDTTPVVVDASGNVGIGTTVPGSWINGVLDVRVPSDTDYVSGSGISNSGLMVYNPTSGAANSAGVYLGTESNGEIGLFAVENAGNTAADFTIKINRVEKFRIESGGNVGIGTAGPQSELDIRGTYTAENGGLSQPIVNIISTNAAATDTGGTLQFGGETGQPTSPYGFASIKGAKSSAGTYGGYLSFFTVTTGSALTERMRIEASGNVGIGTTGPGNRLEVSDTTDTATPLLVRGSNTGGGIALYKQLSILNQNTSANTITGLALQHYNAASAVKSAASLEASLSTVTAGSEEGFLAFTTMRTGTLTEAMRILNSGNVGIGTTAPGAKLAINSNIGTMPTNTDFWIAGRGQGDGSSTDSRISMGFDSDASQGAYIKVVGASTSIPPAQFTFGTRASSVDTDTLTIKSGNVGIGTTTPTSGYKLDVVNAGGTGIRIGDTTNLSRFQTQWADATGTVTAGKDGAVSTAINFNTQTAAGATTNTLSLNAGNVGIGTTGPQAKLHVGTVPVIASDVSTTAVLAASVAGTAYPLTLSNTVTPANANRVLTTYTFGPTQSATAYMGAVQENSSTFATGLVFGTYSAGLGDRLYIQSNGNVGIGTTSPNSKLEVTGGIGVNRAVAVATGNIDISGSYLTNGADYAEYFEAEGELLPGDIAGISIAAGKARKYIPGDTFIGIVAKTPGIIGNNKDNKEGYALIGLLGQMEFKQDQVVIEDRVVQTKDGKNVGILLSNGKVLIGN